MNRRDFLATAAATTLLSPMAFAGHRSMARLKIGVIGCGGRGSGAAGNALEASPDVEIYALGDLFPERIASCRAELTKLTSERSSRVTVTDERCFSGFDAYKQVVSAGVDVVILATPPHFRPIHLAAAVEKGKHVFMEKPVATDPAGIRSVLRSAELANAGNLCIVTGTQRRHEKCYLDMMQRIHDGAIGTVVSANVYWNQGGLWMHDRQEKWSDMEWQLRNWLYFTWLSGDHIVEQHVHNIDVGNWLMGGHPTRCIGMGGRQSRTSPAYGHVFDHFAIEYQYANGGVVNSMCRQADGATGRVEELAHGTAGRAFSTSGRTSINGEKTWKSDDKQTDPYVQEHIDLYKAITSGKTINEATRVAESTLTAIMGRMSAYTGKEITWEQAMNSKLDLSPPEYKLGSLPVPAVAIPGKTPMI